MLTERCIPSTNVAVFDVSGVFRTCASHSGSKVQATPHSCARAEKTSQVSPSHPSLWVQGPSHPPLLRARARGGPPQKNTRRRKKKGQASAKGKKKKKKKKKEKIPGKKKEKIPTQPHGLSGGPPPPPEWQTERAG